MTASRYAAALLAGLIALLIAVPVPAAESTAAPTPTPARTEPAGSPTTESANAKTTGAPAAATRIIRVKPAKVRVIEGVTLTTQELLDENFALFDAQALEIVEPRRLANEIGRSLWIAELVNRSEQYIAIDPKLDMAFFEKARGVKLHPSWALPETLYPGERVPVMYGGEGFDKITEFKPAWQAMRRAALPGPRPALTISIDKTDARIGRGTLNFTYRYQYKYVVVSGRVTNDADHDVSKINVWVSLYDAKDRVTGAEFDELRLPVLKPGDSAPFEVAVKQYGANFERVGIVYDAEGK